MSTEEQTRKRLAGFLRLARENLEAAKILAPTGNRNAAYQCGQAAEQGLRAILLSEGVHGGTHHMLDRLVSLIPDENPLKVDFREIQHLASYLTSYRYPTNVGRIKAAPKPEDLERDLDRTESVLKSLADHFGVDLDDPDSFPDRTDPPR